MNAGLVVIDPNPLALAVAVVVGVGAGVGVAPDESGETMTRYELKSPVPVTTDDADIAVVVSAVAVLRDCQVAPHPAEYVAVSLVYPVPAAKSEIVFCPTNPASTSALRFDGMMLAVVIGDVVLDDVSH